MSDFESRSLKITCVGEELWLHPQRVMYWPQQSTLLVADIHLGKEHAFSRSGIAIPDGISDDVLARLFALCDASQAETLTILGDFMHTTPQSGERWLTTLSSLLEERPRLTIRIVAGNHDRPAGQLMTDSRILWHRDAIRHGPFMLQHEPLEQANSYVLAGHLHPAWRLQVTGHRAVRAPVFWFRSHYAVLPAFGTFTGGMRITPDARHDRLYMIGGDCVLPVPAEAIGRSSRRTNPS